MGAPDDGDVDGDELGCGVRFRNVGENDGELGAMDGDVGANTALNVAG